MPNALIIAQAFKESLGVAAVAAALGQGGRDAGWIVDVVLGSDGGDGLLDAVEAQFERWTSYEAIGPFGRPVRPRVGWLDGLTAVVESRLVIGLSLVPEGERRPLRATTRGLGLLLDRVVADGAKQVIVGLGGSATVDGGMGMARAWGWVPYSKDGRILTDGGGSLVDVARFEPGRPLGAAVTALCDVTNPLVGPDGAAPVFAPQKGASPDDVARLARGLERLVAATGERGAECAGRPGAGAAGGTGFGLAYFSDGELVSGAEWVLDRAGFTDRLARADALVVCEGAFDRTSLHGKLVGRVLECARLRGKPVLLVTPRASDVPEDVVVESGGGGVRWSAGTIRTRAVRGLGRVRRLLPP